MKTKMYQEEINKRNDKDECVDKEENIVETNEPHNEKESQNSGSYDEENDTENTYEDSGEEAYESNEENKNDSDKNGKGSQETKFQVVFLRQENDDKGPDNEDNKQGSEGEINQRNSPSEERKDPHSDGKTSEGTQDSDPTKIANNDTKDEIEGEYSGSKDEEGDIHEDKNLPSNDQGTSYIAKENDWAL